MNVLVALLLLAAPTSPSAGPDADGPEAGRVPHGTCRVEAIPDAASPATARRQPRYSISRSLSAGFRVWTTPKRHVPRARLHLYSPDGRVYSVLRPSDAGLPAEDASPNGRASAPRYVEMGLGIAGSQVMWGSMYGRWWAVPYLDGAERPCGAPVAFTIGK